MPSTKHVLVVEDDQDVLVGARLRLEAAGYDVISARDGAAGVAAATQTHPDAIVMDIQMPNMDGLAALQRLRLRQDTRSIPVVMLSASVTERKAALDAGARYYLKKPYQAKALLEALRAAVSSAPAEHLPVFVN